MSSRPANLEGHQAVAFLAALVRGLIIGQSAYQISDEDNRRIVMGLRLLMRLPPAARSIGELRGFLGGGIR